MPIITDLYYLPPLEYFVAILDQTEIRVDVKEKFQKQTYRNRAYIRLTNKIETLSIPVLSGSSRMDFVEVEIDYTQKWKNVHLRGFQSAYGKAPFYEYYFPYIAEVYRKNLTNLVSLNLELLTVCLKLLQIKIPVKVGIPEKSRGDSTDIRGMINPKEDFAFKNIYRAYPYPQVFGVDFVPNLSVLDLLFCVGPDSKEILYHSKIND